MENKIYRWMWVLLLIFVACGKAKPQLVLKIDDADRGQPAVGLAKKLIVSYRDEFGNMKLSKAYSISNLSQPSSVNANDFADVDVKKEGSWQASAHADDGLLLFSGEAKADPQDKPQIELTLRLDSKLKYASDSALKQIRIENVQGIEDFILPARLLKESADLGQCYSLPKFKITPHTLVFPTLVFEGNLQAAPLFFDGGIQDEKGNFKPMGEILKLEETAPDQSRIELGRNFYGGIFLKSAYDAFVLRVFSKILGRPKLEGCLKLATELDVFKIEPEFTTLDPGNKNDDGRPAGKLVLTNKNSMPLTVEVSSFGRWNFGFPTYGFYYYKIGEEPTKGDRSQNPHSPTVDELHETITIAPKSQVVIYFLGVEINPTFFAKRGYVLEWTVKTIVPGAVKPVVQEIKTPVL